MAELPATMKEQIPTLSISVHAYSAKPADRLAGINGRLLREGDYPAPQHLVDCEAEVSDAFRDWLDRTA